MTDFECLNVDFWRDLIHITITNRINIYLWNVFINPLGEMVDSGAYWRISHWETFGVGEFVTGGAIHRKPV